MKTAKELAHDYWSRPQGQNWFIPFIREVQADAMRECLAAADRRAERTAAEKSMSQENTTTNEQPAGAAVRSSDGLGSQSNPHTVAPEDWAENGVEYAAHCKCWLCGIVAPSTIAFDFYADEPGQKLKCERCLLDGHFKGERVVTA